MSTMRTITEHLGGAKALGARPRTAAEWQDIIHAGVPMRSAEALKGSMALPDKLFAQLLGISEKTLSRSRAGRGRLDPVASDRLFRVARIVALAIEVLENEERAMRWLKREQIGLGRRTPLSFLGTEAGRVEVERLLMRIEHGVYS